jgi:DNA repair protein RadC
MLIRDIPNNERPRERLIKYGVDKLSNEELLSIILSSGVRNKSCKELSLDIISEFDSINNLKNLNIKSLSNIKGIGVSKASIILASIEFGRRVYSDNNIDIKLNSSEDIYNYIKNDLIDKKQEYFYALYLDNKNKLIDKKLLFIGTVNRSIVHPREIFKYAYLYSASSIVIVHNHPSGDVTPSKEDKILTDSIIELGNINKIPVIDHIIVGKDRYYSFT